MQAMADLGMFEMGRLQPLWGSFISSFGLERGMQPQIWQKMKGAELQLSQPALNQHMRRVQLMLICWWLFHLGQVQNVIEKV